MSSRRTTSTMRGSSPGPDERVDLRHLGEELGAVALGQAAGHDEAAARDPGLPRRQLEDRLDRLLLGPVDERARVHDDAVGCLGLGPPGLPRPGRVARASARRRPGSWGSRGSRDGRSWQESSIASGSAGPAARGPRSRRESARQSAPRCVSPGAPPRRRSDTRGAGRRESADTARQTDGRGGVVTPVSRERRVWSHSSSIRSQPGMKRMPVRAVTRKPADSSRRWSAPGVNDFSIP